MKGMLGVMAESYLDCKFTRIPRFCSLIAWNRKTWSSGYSTKPFVTVEHPLQGLNYPGFLLQCRCFENCYMNLVVSNPHFCNLSTQHDRMALVELHEQMLSPKTKLVLNQGLQLIDCVCRPPPPPPKKKKKKRSITTVSRIDGRNIA